MSNFDQEHLGTLKKWGRSGAESSVSGQKKRTQYPGVRYREHGSRLHNGRLDRYFTIRYKVNDKTIEEALGWASEGWNAEKASLQRSKLREAHKTGEGAQTLSEKRRQHNQKLIAERLAEERSRNESKTFSQYFNDLYRPHSAPNKAQKTNEREETLHRLWIEPEIGQSPLKNITHADIEKIKQDIIASGRKPRTAEYAIALVRQVFNHARVSGVFNGVNPTSGISRIQYDNDRRRFLTRDEADLLLDALRGRSEQTYQIALVSLYSGARAGEILGLKWGDIDLTKKTMVLWDTKNSQSRTILLNDVLIDLFTASPKGRPDTLVFPNRKGEKQSAVSKTFSRTVDDIGLNEGITDTRMKVVFHTLRHTFGSWMAESGANPFQIKRSMGHKGIGMTERYVHVHDDSLRSIVNKIGKTE